jgi:hypothetical protein
MRWESDFAALATLHDCRSPQAQSLKPGPRHNRESQGWVATPRRYAYEVARTEFTVEPVDIGLAFSVKLAPKF